MNWIVIIEKLLPTVCGWMQKLTKRKPKALTFLVVEDDPNDAERLQRYLSRLGHKWEWAQTAEEAIGLVSHANYNALFVDLRLSQMSGAELMRTLSKRGRKPKKIVVCGQPHDLELITPSQPLHIIRKPVNLESVEDMINDLKL